MIRALIADDEPLSRRVLQQLLARHPDVTIVAECPDGASAADAITRLSPDVVFLDVRMPVLDGLEVAKRQANGPLIVFVTAFEEFALPAFDVAAADYLTKPVAEPRFDEALNRVRDRLRGKRIYPAHLVARVGQRNLLLRVETLEYIEADDVYAAVVSRGRRYLLRTSLDVLERSLDPARFLRIHRSYIVAVERVSEVRRSPRAIEVIVDGIRLPVSRRRRLAVERLLEPLAT
jgi:two-component system LytT family response regulator